MAVKYRVNFGTFHGTQGNYRMDISNTSYSGGIEETISDEEVISISYTKDYDDYSPIISSKANVTLVETNEITYDRFQEDGNQQWKVEMLYEDPDNAGNYILYWAGWIVSESYSESIITTPTYVSFVATDGIGDLSRLIIDPSTSEDDQPLLEYIRLGLNKTGLGLNILYNTGLEAVSSVGTDYLESTTCHPYAFYENDLTERITELERIETVLQSINCRLFQSGGSWRITSWSDYNGTIVGNNENITFNAINASGLAIADVTENVRYEIKRSSGNNVDLISAYGDLERTWRDPFFSVTQRIDNYTLASINANPLFEIGGGSTGYTWPNVTIPESFSTTNVLNGTRSVTTTVNSPDDTTSEDTRWFQSVGIAPPRFGSGYKVRFSFRSDFISSSAAKSEIRYRVIVDYDNNTGGVIFGNTDYHVWNFERGLWHGEDVDARGDGGYDAQYIGRAESVSSGEWNDVEVDVSGTFGLGDNPRFRIEIHSPVALSVSDSVISSAANNNLIVTYVDNVRVLPFVSFQEAHFERNLNDSRNYTKQYETTTFLTSRGEDIFYNRVNNIEVRRTGTTENLSLEEIITQQRLNDYRDGGRFYSGTFINNSDHPLALHHKPFVTYSGTSENTGGVIDEIAFSARSNQSRILFRVPDQATDVESTFNTFNVEPQVIIPDTSPFRTLTLDMDFIGTDDLGAPITYVSGTDTLNVITGSDLIRQFSGLPGTTQQYTLEILTDENQSNRYELGVSNWYRMGSLQDPDVADTSDPDYIPIPDYVEILSINQDGSNISVNFQITIPHRNDTVELAFTGEADPFLASNRSYTLNFSLATTVMNAMVSSTSRTLRGAPGDVSFTQVIISPTAGFELDATTFADVGALPTGVTNLGFSQLGNSVIGEYSVEFQSTNQTSSILINAADGTALAGVNTSTLTLDLVDNLTNASTIADFSVTGIVGSTAEFSIPIYAADTFELDPDNFSLTSSSGVVVMRDAVGGREAITIPVVVTFPSSNQTVTLTLGGIATLIGATDLVDVTITFVNNIVNTVLTETSETFTLPAGSQINYTNQLVANDGYNLVESGVSIVESTSTSTVDFSAQQSGRDTVNLTTTIITPSADESITVNVNGTAVAEPYTLTIGVQNNITSTELSANQIVIGYDDEDIGQAFNRTLTIQSNSTEMAFTDEAEVARFISDTYDDTPRGMAASTGTTVIEGSTFSAGVITISVGGTFPVPNGAGISNIELQVNRGDPTGTPPLVPATASGTTIGNGGTVRSGETFTVSVVSDGAWEIDDGGIGPAIDEVSVVFTPRSGIGSGVIIGSVQLIAGTNGQIVNGDGSDGLNGFEKNQTYNVLSLGTSTVVATGTLTGSVRSVTRNDPSNPLAVQSNDVTSINVNIGGTAGSVSGILYIT